MIKGLVSILIPCYNSEKYIADCLDSILHQTYRNLEVIIVNDGSVDKTYEIIKTFEDNFKRVGILVKVLSQENAGQAVAINRALKYVNGEFLVWQDSDDCYSSDGIKLLIEYLEAHKNVQFVRGEVLCFNENMDKVLEHGKSKYPDETNIFDFYVFETDSYCWPGIFMVRMEYFDSCIPNREIYVARAGQNLALILPVAYRGKCGYVNKVVYNYRVREDSFYHSVKGLQDLLKREDEHKTLLLNILEWINMPEKEKAEYKSRVDYKYIKIKRFLYVENFFKMDKCGKILKKFCKKYKINTAAIYGMGTFGTKLFDILKKIDVKVSYAIDRNACSLEICGLKVVSLGKNLEKVDIIIISSPNFFDDMISELQKNDIYNYITLDQMIKVGEQL